MSPICVPCAREMRCARNGVYCWREHGSYAVGDRWQCPTCGAQVVTGFSADMHAPPSQIDKFKRAALDISLRLVE